MNYSIHQNYRQGTQFMFLPPWAISKKKKRGGMLCETKAECIDLQDI